MERGGNQKSDLSWLYQVINIYVELFKFRSCKNDLDATISILNIHMGTQIEIGEGRERQEEKQRGRERGESGEGSQLMPVELNAGSWCRYDMSTWHTVPSVGLFNEAAVLWVCESAAGHRSSSLSPLLLCHLPGDAEVTQSFHLLCPCQQGCGPVSCSPTLSALGYFLFPLQPSPSSQKTTPPNSLPGELWLSGAKLKLELVKSATAYGVHSAIGSNLL